MSLIKEKRPVEKPATTTEQWVVVGYKCNRCGKESEEDWPDGDPWPMTEFRVESAPGEEGGQVVEAFFCADCLDLVSEAMVALGVCTHYHGSTNFLEDTRCPGYNHPAECPTPQRSRYGNIQPEDEEEYDV